VITGKKEIGIVIKHPNTRAGCVENTNIDKRGRRMKLIWALGMLLFVVVLPVALLTGNVRWIANDLSFYQRGYERQFSYQTTGIPKEELDRATGEMIAYFNNSGGDFSNIQVRAGGKTFRLFNERDVVHLRDVRDLIQLTYRIQEVSLAYVFLFSAAMLFRRNGKRLLVRLAWPWLLGGVFTTLLLIAVGLGMLLDFDRMFLAFHLVSFTNDFWVLDPATSYLIRMVPEGFFMELALTTAVLALAEAVALAIVTTGSLAWHKGRRFSATTQRTPSAI